MVARLIENIADDSVAIDQCSNCGNGIALRSPTEDWPASAWLCSRCGSVYLARCQERNGIPFGGGAVFIPYNRVIQAVNANIDEEAYRIRRKDVLRLIECLNGRKFFGRNKRRQPRHPLVLPVTVVPLGPDFRISGQPSRTRMMNVSNGGAAIFHPRRIVEPYIVIDFAGAGVALAPVLLRVTRVQYHGSVYEVAGQFVCKIWLAT